MGVKKEPGAEVDLTGPVQWSGGAGRLRPRHSAPQWCQQAVTSSSFGTIVSKHNYPAPRHAVHRPRKGSFLCSVPSGCALKQMIVFQKGIV